MITDQELNRAVLARQMLLERSTLAVDNAIARIGAIQAQEARPPFIALWSRLAGFTRERLLDAVRNRNVIRATAMRATLHLMQTDDYLLFRPALQPGLDTAMSSILKKRGDGIDLDTILDFAGRFFSGGELTFEELRAVLEANFPGIDIRASAYAIRLRLPLAQVPDLSTWGWSSDPKFTLAYDWLGTVEANSTDDALDALVRRYLGAFGPASTTDFQTWAGLKGAKEVFERLRPELATFRDERGRELFDLLDAPRPDAGVTCPVRYLPDFDSLLLAYSDRSRIIADEYRTRVTTANLRVLATFLVDGFVRGTWKIVRKGKTVSLLLSPFTAISPEEKASLQSEGESLLQFVEPDAAVYDIGIEPA